MQRNNCISEGKEIPFGGPPPRPNLETANLRIDTKATNVCASVLGREEPSRTFPTLSWQRETICSVRGPQP